MTERQKYRQEIPANPGSGRYRHVWGKAVSERTGSAGHAQPGIHAGAGADQRGYILEGVALYRTEAAHGLGEAAGNNYRAFGLPADASGVVFTHPEETTLYVAGDTVWYEGVAKAIQQHQPGIIVVNAALAAFADETPILMGTDGLGAVVAAAPNALVVASHLDTVNHAHIGRKEVRQWVREQGLSSKVFIPEDGESLHF